jgi:hypothetical protein
MQGEEFERRLVHAVEVRVTPQGIDLGPGNRFGRSEH